MQIASSDDFLTQLPLPLAQLYRRAQNATRAEDRHLHAYYLAEATLKLAASLRIGLVLHQGVAPGSPLARRLEKLCMPMVGEWVGFLRESAHDLLHRPDAALLPLAAENEALLQHGALPEVRAFGQAVSSSESDEHQPLHARFVNDSVKQGILGFFTIIASYRNKVIGHGAPKLPAYYERVGPLLLNAIREVLRQRCLFGDLTLAVCRLNADPTGQRVQHEWRRLVNLGSLLMPPEEVGRNTDPTGAAEDIVPGHVYFVGDGTRVSLHPLALYLEDRSERERVAFLNDTVSQRRKNESGETIEEIRRCEYLDYATGDHVRDVDVHDALTRLLACLRGQSVTDSEIERLATASQWIEADPSTIPTSGALIGDFEILGEIGRGAMGVVYRARQRSLNRTVALKVLPPSLAADPILLARFWREIAALARCEHPNLVKIITSGSDGDRHYYAMELVDGADLAVVFDRLARHRPNGIAKALDGAIEIPTLQEWGSLFTNAAVGLAHLHARGILHRDLKPANVMLTTDRERLVIMDLGLAQVHDRTQALTQVTTGWLGTLRYCAPEQLRWNLLDVDERADIYGFGATLYEILTRRRLFDGDSEARLIEQILHEEPRDPHTLDLTIPRDLSAIVMHCLEKDRTQRYASADALAVDLRRYCEGLPVSVRPLTKPQRLWRWCRNHRALASLTALVVSLLLIVSVGATTAAILQAKQIRKTLDAEDKARTEQSQREELERIENAADFAMIKEQIRADRFLEAHQTIENARKRLKRSETLANERSEWNRIARVVAFYSDNDSAWNAWGEEDYRGVHSCSTAALAALASTDAVPWWDALPTESLDSKERERFATEVYRLLMLKSAVSTVTASVLAEAHRDAPEELANIVPHVRLAMQTLEQAQTWEMEQHNAISIASNIMEQVNRRLLQLTGQSGTALAAIDREVRLSKTDYYFLGLMFFVIERASSGQRALCPVEFGATIADKQATDSRGKADQGLLSSLLYQELARHEIPRGSDPLDTSERLLRVGAGREQRYWPNFALGRTLYLAGKYSEAELAFSTCASLRLEYARSYEQRALMLALQAANAPDEEHRQTLQRLAQEDSERALDLAHAARDPSTLWPRGDLLVLLDQPYDALHAYAHAIQADESIRERVNRRNNMVCVTRLARSMLDQPDTSAEVRAQAYAVLALVSLAQDESASSLEQVADAAASALELVPNHSDARTVRGRLALRAAERYQQTGDPIAAETAWNSALDDFDTALQQAPWNFQAARGRALALEHLGRWEDARDAWTAVLETDPRSKPLFGDTIVLTDSQHAQAELGKARALEQLGSVPDAPQAIETVHESSPSLHNESGL